MLSCAALERAQVKVFAQKTATVPSSTVPALVKDVRRNRFVRATARRRCSLAFIRRQGTLSEPERCDQNTSAWNRFLVLANRFTRQDTERRSASWAVHLRDGERSGVFWISVRLFALFIQHLCISEHYATFGYFDFKQGSRVQQTVIVTASRGTVWLGCFIGVT